MLFPPVSIFNAKLVPASHWMYRYEIGINLLIWLSARNWTLSRNSSCCLTWPPERRSVCVDWSSVQTCWTGSRRVAQPGLSETLQRGPGESLPPGAETNWQHLLCAVKIKITVRHQIISVTWRMLCVQWNETNPVLLVNDLTLLLSVNTRTHADKEFLCHKILQFLFTCIQNGRARRWGHFLLMLVLMEQWKKNIQQKNNNKTNSVLYLLFIYAEIINANSTANSQASGQEPGTQINPKVLQLFREG